MASTHDESLDSAQLAEIRRQLQASEGFFSNSNNRSAVQESPAAVRRQSDAHNATHDDSIEDPTAPPRPSQPRPYSQRAAGRKHAAAAPLALAKSSPLLLHPGPDAAGDYIARMAQSFAGFAGDGDGDTQPLDTQVYRQYTSSAIGMSSAARPAPGSQANVARVDLASDWDRPEDVEDSVSIVDGDVSELSPATQSVVREATDVAFAVPKTPALAGRKRNNRGELVDSAARTSEPKTSSTKTPGTELSVGLLGHANAANLMSLTQAFNQTQAPSSPLPVGARSDPVFERPSPNFQPPRATSPIPRTSSPTKEVRGDFSRAVTEPIEQYRTMKESQEERRRRRMEEDNFRGETSDILDGDDDDLFNIPTTVEKRAKRLREHAASSTGVFDRSARFASRRGRPVSRSKESSRAHTSDFGAVVDGQEVQIPMTSSKPGLQASNSAVVRSSPLYRLGSAAQEVPATASQSEKHAARPPRATQATAIEDSQKERTDSQKENDDPEFDGASDAGDPPANPRSLPALSQVDVSFAQTRKVPQTTAADLANNSVVHSADISSQPEAAGGDALREMPSSPPMMTSDSRDEDEAADETRHAQDVIDYVKEPSVASQRGGSASALVGVAASAKSEERPSQTDTGRINRQHSTTTNTNGTSTAYQTAQSHRTQSPTKPSATQDSTATGRTPRSTRTRKLTDIAADPTPRPSFEQMDLDGLNVMNDDDNDFTRIMSGSSPVRPSRRKRIVYGAKARHSAAQPGPPTTPPSAKKQNEAASGDEALKGTPGSPMRISARKREQGDAQAASNTRKAAASQQVVKGADSAGKLKRPTRKSLAKNGAVETAQTGIPDDRLVVPTIEDPAARPAPGPNSNRSTSADTVNPAAAQSVTRPAESTPQNRVIALCRDTARNYWPATCLGVERDGRLRVVFDDGTDDVVEPQHVRRFDLRPGDTIKIDLPAMKKRDYIIQATSATTISVSAKPSGKGAMAGKVTPATPITIPIAQAYLTGMLWPQLKGREYIHAPPTASGAPLSTPAPMQAPSAVPTPASRSRRAAAGALKQELQRETSTPSFRAEGTLFHGMAFAVSFKDETSSERKSSLRSLTENGAQLLDSGFEALFTVPDVATEASNASGGADALQMSGAARSLGFVALITDTHSRRPKYLQALALGLPCLHHRWVSDSVAAKQALAWDKYLLPAGDSAWLGGSVKSRTMQTYEPGGARFAETISNRARFLRDDGNSGILLVDATVPAHKPGKGAARAKKPVTSRGLDERRKRFVFMMCAIGARHFRRVRDIAEAKALAAVGEAGEWAWVYIDGDVRAAEILLSGDGLDLPANTGKKRKHVEMEVGPAAAQGIVRVVNDEFIIQSLILGGLAD